MSRRSMLVQAVRKNAAKQKAPLISVISDFTREPFAVWSLNHREPTKAEIAAAVAQWKREHAKQKDAPVQDTQNTMKPAQGSGDEETD